MSKSGQSHMKIFVKNLGALRQAEFAIGDMTIVCGENNTGKTYATYALYGFLATWREYVYIQIPDDVVQQLLAEGVVHIDVTTYAQQASNILKDGCITYSKQLAKVFAAPADKFKESFFDVELQNTDHDLGYKFERTMRAADAKLFSMTKSVGSTDLVITLLAAKEDTIRIPTDVLSRIISEAMKDVIFGHHFPTPFIASAERTGAAIFRKELNLSRNRLLEEMMQTDKNLDPLDLLFKEYQDYALPVKANVDFTRQLETVAKKTSVLAEEYPDILRDFADIIGGEYTVNANDELYYTPKGKKRVRLSMDESSSAVRSLLDIGFYIKHLAKPGDLLMVDEPELNLHPKNQRRVARLFARLVNLGVKVFMTTHSDYIVKELNTLLMMNRDKQYLRSIAEEEGYRPQELLRVEQLRVFIAE
jgi:ABC-type branched-subunit amino acid transport system ATPase component